MALRSKSKIRLLILMSCMTVAGGSVVGVWYVHKQKRLADVRAMLPAGLQAYRDGEIVQTVSLLGQYLRESDSSNVEALEAYAKARMQLAEKNNDHLKDVEARYRRLVTLRPNNDDYKHELLRVYAKLEKNTEILQLANTMLAKNPKDGEAREIKTAALMSLRKYDPASMVGMPGTDKDADPEVKLSAIESAQKTLAYDPLSPVAVLQVLQIMKEEGKSAAEMQEWGLGVKAGHENEPEGAYVEALAYGYGGKDKESQAAMMRCQAVPPKTAKFASQIVQMMDNMELFTEATAFLARNVAALQDAELTELYYRRLAYAGAFEKVENELSAADMHSEKSTVLTALRAIALCEMHKLDQAKPLLEVLSQRGQRWDYAANDWRSVLEIVYFTDNPRQRDVIETCLEAASRKGDEAYFQVYLGDAYAASGDSSAAIVRWQNARNLAPSWVRPWMKLASLFELTNNPETALALATQADKRQPDQEEILVTRARAWAATLTKPNHDDPKELAALLERIRKLFPKAEATLPLEVELAYQMEPDHAKGVTIARQRMQEILNRQEAASEATLLRMAVISFQDKLDLQAACLAAAEKTYGVTPQWAWTRAGLRAEGGDKVGALAELTAARKKALDAPGVSKENVDGWNVVWCRFLESTGDPSATEEWKKIVPVDAEGRVVVALDAHGKVDTAKNDTKMLWALIASPAARKDRKFMGSVLDALEALNGDTGLSWRVEKARWLLEDPSRESQAKATTLLTETVRVSQNSPAVRELLAKAYDNAGDPSSAASQLVAAAEMDQQNLSLRINAARMLVRLNEKSRAVPLLKSVTEAGWATDMQRLQSGVLLAQADVPDIAKKILESTAEVDGKKVPLVSLDSSNGAALTLAGLYWQQRDKVHAEAAFEALLTHPTADIIEQAAAYYLSQNNAKRAEEVIAQIADMKDVDAGRKALVQGRYAAQIGKTADAVKFLQEAVAASPEQPDAWRWLVSSLLTEKRQPEAITAAQSAIKALDGAKAKLAALRAEANPSPKKVTEAMQVVDLMQALASDPAIKACADNKSELRNMLADDDARGYMVGCLMLPGDAKGVESAAGAFKTGNNGDIAKSLQVVGDAHRDSLGLQILLVRKLILAGSPELALDVANRAMNTFPNSPVAASYASTCSTMMGKYDDALRAAERWRANTVAEDVAPDLQTAKAMLSLTRGKDAEALLEAMLGKPDTWAAKTKDSKFRETLFLCAASIVEQGRVKAASDMLWPMIETEPKLKDAWSRLGSDWVPVDAAPGQVSAEAWLKRQSDSVKPDDFEGEVREGMAEFYLGERTRAPLLQPNDEKLVARHMADGKRLAEGGLKRMLDAVERRSADTSGDEDLRKRQLTTGLMVVASAFEYLHDYENAAVYYDRVIKVEPRMHPAKNNLAMVLAQPATTREKLDKALMEINEAIKAQNNVPAYYDTLSFVYKARGEFDQAIIAIKKAIDLEPTNPLWQVNLVGLLIDASKMTEAKAALENLDKLHFDPAGLPTETKDRYEQSRAKLKPA